MTATATEVSGPISGVRPNTATETAATSTPAAPPSTSGSPSSAATTRPGKSAWASDSAL